MKRTATILLLTVLMALITGHAEVPQAKGTSWGSISALPGTDPSTNVFPKLLQSSNGSIWLVWEKVSNGYGQIYLMVNNGFGWSGQIPLVNSNGTFDDISPALVQLANGTIILAWSRGISGTGCLSTMRMYDLYTESYTNGRWTSPTLLVQAPGDDVSPAMARLSDGRVALVWSRCTSTNGGGDIYYKTFNGTWDPEAALVATPAEEKLPSISQANDGRVWVIYSSNTGTGSSNLLDDVVWNGASWTSPAQLTNAGVDDDWSSMAQDRNGTIWLFWSRNIFNGTVSGVPTYQYDLFYMNSTNNGLSWSPEQTIAPNINSQDLQPSIIQTSTKRLWLVYSSDQKQGNPYRTENLYLIASDIIKIHDLGLTSITPPASAPLRRVGETLNITTTITNLGDYIETAPVNCYANSTLVYSQPITLNPGQTAALNIPWNSAGGNPGNYLLKATVGTVAGEFLTANNSLNSSYFLTLQGDSNRDGKVDILDISTVSAHFGAVKGASNWYSNADLNVDNVINILDLTYTTSEFGRSIKIHDLAIVNVTPPKITPRIGETVQFTASVADIGGYNESSTVNFYVNQVLTKSTPITLAAGQVTVVNFSWNSTSKPAGRYSVSISVSTVNGEFQTTNNMLNSTFTLTFRGDVNRDLTVNILDVSQVNSRFGATSTSPNYLAEADLNHDGIINILDVAIVNSDFGKTLI